MKTVFRHFTQWGVLIRFVGRILRVVLALLLIMPSPLYAQQTLHLPAPGALLASSPTYIPPLVKGLKVFPNEPFRFDFLIDTGQSGLDQFSIEEETEKLVKYFLAALTVPENELWVNLSPYERDRIIPMAFGVTAMGRDLLSQDYILKQLTASLMYPENELGSRFWERVRVRARDEFGISDLPVNTFNKVWIVPERAVVYFHQQTAFIKESRLKVMLEQDYQAMRENLSDRDSGMDSGDADGQEALDETSSAVIRELIIPELEREVNEGEHFALLRQIYHAMVLATWFKRNLKDSLVGRVYAEHNKVAGIEIDDLDVKDTIYNQYLEAFKTGVFDMIREEYDPVTQQIIPRKYFSGGFTRLDGDVAMVAVDPEQLVREAQKPDGAMLVARIKLSLPGFGGNRKNDKVAKASQTIFLTAKPRSVGKRFRNAGIVSALLASLYIGFPHLIYYVGASLSTGGYVDWKKNSLIGVLAVKGDADHYRGLVDGAEKGPDILAIYLGLKENTLPLSDGRPQTQKYADTQFYSIREWSMFDPKYIPSETLLKLIYDPPNTIYRLNNSVIQTDIDLGQYQVSATRADGKVYASLFDVWDFQTDNGGYYRSNNSEPLIKRIQPNIMNLTGTVYGSGVLAFYDRYYFDPVEELQKRGLPITRATTYEKAKEIQLLSELTQDLWEQFHGITDKRMFLEKMRTEMLKGKYYVVEDTLEKLARTHNQMANILIGEILDMWFNVIEPIPVLSVTSIKEMVRRINGKTGSLWGVILQPDLKINGILEIVEFLSKTDEGLYGELRSRSLNGLRTLDVSVLESWARERGGRVIDTLVILDKDFKNASAKKILDRLSRDRTRNDSYTTELTEVDDFDVPGMVNTAVTKTDPDPVGGIDLNPELFELIEEGGADFTVPGFDPSVFDGIQINGFTPVILNIQPFIQTPFFFEAVLKEDELYSAQSPGIS